ncbi:hypothetical protein EDB19DRAFT_1652911 [Suillus lakei]|jgi:uncharacterized membrane-anchored protein YitT (DUF2179 family)|nr:hypothetical protein EDB19DRAFT_1652911 [Suillus lakei]
MIKGLVICIGTWLFAISGEFFLQAHPVSSVHIPTAPLGNAHSSQAPKFHLQVSATLKRDGRSLCQAMQRLVALIAAALRVMHPNLYWASLATQLALGLWAADKKLDAMGAHLREWASIFTAVAIVCNWHSPLHHDPLSHPQWFNVMTSVGNYGAARMEMPNIGIEIVYGPGAMAVGSGRILRHGVDMGTGRIAWVWYSTKNTT